MKNLFTEPCSNCLSAMTGGDPNWDTRVFCVVCSDPETGEIRGWTWRWCWLHRVLVSNRNFKRVIEARTKHEV